MLKTNLPRSTQDRLNLALDLLIDYMLENYQEDIAIRQSKRRQNAISSEKQKQSKKHARDNLTGAQIFHLLPLLGLGSGERCPTRRHATCHGLNSHKIHIHVAR